MRTTAPVLCLAFLASLALAPGAAAGPTTIGDDLDSSLQGIQDAVHLLQTMDRVGAVASLDGSMASADDAVAIAADPGNQASFGKLATKVTKTVGAFHKALQGARTVMADPNAPALKAVKAASKASKTGNGVAAVLRGLPIRGVGITEKKPGSAGFHNSGDPVTIRILPGLDAGGLPCTETPVIAVIDPYGIGTVVPGYSTPVVAPDGSTTIVVIMGDVGGPARVEVSACGITRRLLLYNYGPSGTFAPKVSVDRFDGTYTGTYSGTFTVPGLGTQPVSGGVTLTVAGGNITVTAPSPGTGTVTASGGAGLAAAGGGANYKFAGKFTATSLGTGPGTAVAAGAWTATGNGGTGKGTWSVSR